MKYTLYIGNFHPFNDDNKAKVHSLLKEGKNVLIAIWHPSDPNNSSTCIEAMDVIHQSFHPKFKDRVRITVIGYQVEEIVQE